MIGFIRLQNLFFENISFCKFLSKREIPRKKKKKKWIYLVVVACRPSTVPQKIQNKIISFLKFSTTYLYITIFHDNKCMLTNATFIINLLTLTYILNCEFSKEFVTKRMQYIQDRTKYSLLTTITLQGAQAKKKKVIQFLELQMFYELYVHIVKTFVITYSKNIVNK